jgi:REP element-mobilizing transposase RayT
VVREVWRRLPALYARVELDEIAIMADHVHAVMWLTDCGATRTPLGEIVRGWKGSACRQIRARDPTFGWQSHFHDRVIRTPEALARISDYIRRNISSLGPGCDSSHPPPL